MKNFKVALAAVAVGIVFSGAQPAAAALYNFSNGGSGTLYTGGGSGLSQVIPDNTPAGVAYSVNFAATGLSISDISVSFQMSGGYNGDIYAYLSHGSQIAVLLNPNPAVSGSGFNITLGEGTSPSIPTGGSGTLTGSYAAYSDLATFNNTAPNGAWTVFFADLSPGDTSTLTGFSIAITAVPEPVNVALAIFGGLLGVLSAVRWRQQSRTVFTR